LFLLRNVDQTAPVWSAVCRGVDISDHWIRFYPFFPPSLDLARTPSILLPVPLGWLPGRRDRSSTLPPLASLKRLLDRFFCFEFRTFFSLGSGLLLREGMTRPPRPPTTFFQSSRVCHCQQIFVILPASCMCTNVGLVALSIGTIGQLSEVPFFLVFLFLAPR